MTLPIINQQPQEPQFLRMDGTLEVFKVFPTIQGEGPFAGTPATFVRLSGCNLTCGYCDTDYTSLRQLITPQKLAQLAIDTLPTVKTSLIVITGGEPFRQNITPFVNQLISNGYTVQIETNGTLDLVGFPYTDPNVHIVCSPKTTKIHPRIAPHVTAWKYVLQHGQVDPEDGLPTSALGMGMRVARPFANTASLRPAPTYVQPMDAQNREENDLNMKAAVESSMKFGHKLCLQIHKICHLE